MKFAVAAGVAALASVAVAAPAPQSSGTSTVAGGTINCNTDTKVCAVACGPQLQSVCTLVGAFDSTFYGLEILAGFTIDCTQTGCTVTCPLGTTEGTAVCALDQAGATFDSLFAVGETIIIDGVQSLASDGLSALPLPSGLPSGLPGLPSGLPSLPSGLPTGLGSLGTGTSGLSGLTGLTDIIGQLTSLL